MGTVLLAGTFGHGNPAEEALLTAFLAALPDARVSVITRDPAATRARHGCEAVSASDPVAIARAALRADATVLCGRNVFGDPPPFGGRFPSRRIVGPLALLLVARARGKPAAVVGATVHPLRTPLSRRLGQGVVRMSDLLVLRDDESAEALAEAGALPPFRIGADPAWTVVSPTWHTSTENGDAPHRSRDRVVVALGPPAGRGRALELLAEALQGVVEAGVEVVLQPWRANGRGPDDGMLARYIADRVDPRPPIAPPPADLSAIRSSFERCGVVVALRYQALIAAAAAGVPSVTLEDRPELVGLAHRLGQPVASAGATPADLAGAILRGVEHPAPSAAAVQAHVDAAEEGFRLLRLLISGGKSVDADRVSGLRLDPEAAFDPEQRA
jgi:polysaccharide pyruvyl transferase WcaK-like protein